VLVSTTCSPGDGIGVRSSARLYRVCDEFLGIFYGDFLIEISQKLAHLNAISAPSSISKTVKYRLGFAASTWQGSRDAAVVGPQTPPVALIDASAQLLSPMPPASASAGKLGRIPAQHMVRSGRHDFCVACQRNAAVAASRVVPHESYLREWIPRLVTAEPEEVVMDEADASRVRPFVYPHGRPLADAGRVVVTHLSDPAARYFERENGSGGRQRRRRR
jgi:hypothetical protein